MDFENGSYPSIEIILLIKAHLQCSATGPKKIVRDLVSYSPSKRPVIVLKKHIKFIVFLNHQMICKSQNLTTIGNNANVSHKNFMRTL